MAKRSISNPNSNSILRTLITPTLSDAVLWSCSDLKAIMEHQLNVPLAQELKRLSETSHCSTKKLSAILHDDAKSTFGDILENPSPTIDKVELIKNFAKAAMSCKNDLPPDIARAIYIMAIVRGRLNGQDDISSLDEASIEREVTRCLTFSWLPDRARTVLRSFCDTIDPKRR